jgi:hypothetical protein
MTPGDLIFVLEHLPFRDRGTLVPLKLDRHARDYIIDSLRRRHIRLLRPEGGVGLSRLR